MAQLTLSHCAPCLCKTTEHGCWDGVGWHQPSGNAPVEAGSYTGAAASATSSIRLHRTRQHPVRCLQPLQPLERFRKAAPMSCVGQAKLSQVTRLTAWGQRALWLGGHWPCENTMGRATRRVLKPLGESTKKW